MILIIVIWKDFVVFTGKEFYWSLFLKTFQAWNTANLLKRDSNTSVFLWLNIVKFLRTAFCRTRLVAASEEKLRNSSSRISYFNECFQIFSNFLFWKVYPSTVMHLEQFIFMIYVMDQLAGKKRILKSLSKLIELKFISTKLTSVGYS